MQFCAGQLLVPLHRADQLWRVQRGMVAVLRNDTGHHRLLRLAMPGDWLNLEVASASAAPVDMLALSDCRLQGATTADSARHADWLLQALLQQQARAETVLHLRTGTAHERLTRFVSLLQSVRAADHHPPTPVADLELPALRWLALLLDTTPETACRTLAKLRQRPSVTPTEAFTAAHPHPLAAAA